MNDVSALLSRARDLKAAGKPADALACYRKAVAIAPDNGIAIHNLAAMLGDMYLYTEAAQWSAKAIQLGVRGPETWLVHARALQGEGRLDEADAAYETTLRARPDYLPAHHDLAQLRWMRSADVEMACRHMAGVTLPAPAAAELACLKAQVEISAQDYDRARTTLDRAIAASPAHLGLRLAAAQLAAARGDAAAHMEHTVAALQANRASHTAAKGVVEAMLHNGRADEAEQLAIRILQALPGDQGIVALLTTAWRLLGDPRHEELCADPDLVAGYEIERPEGWSDLNSYLQDLAKALRARHRWKTHPIEQSLRHGSQTQEDLTQSDDPAIRALFGALRDTFARHVDALGQGSDPVRARRGRGFRLGPAWSVELKPGGYHVDHVHPQGWLSSAFYVDLPDAVEEEGRQGWLAFGRPGVPTSPKLDPIRYIHPKPGTLAIFPSYLWHGTEPFSGNQTRLTVALDILVS